MIAQKQRAKMMDYLVSSLEGSDQKIVPVTNAFGNLKANYIRAGDKKSVFLIDKDYSDKALRDIYKMAQINGNDITFVFYKDGETYFKNAAEKNGFKRRDELSLKNYTAEQIRRMIKFTHEEKFVNEIADLMHYYQPESKNLKEGIIGYKFSPIKFNYSHLNFNDGENWFIRENMDFNSEIQSKDIFMWEEPQKENFGYLKLENFIYSDKCPITKPNSCYLAKNN